MILTVWFGTILPGWSRNRLTCDTVASSARVATSAGSPAGRDKSRENLRHLLENAHPGDGNRYGLLRECFDTVAKAIARNDSGDYQLWSTALLGTRCSSVVN